MSIYRIPAAILAGCALLSGITASPAAAHQSEADYHWYHYSHHYHHHYPWDYHRDSSRNDSELDGGY
jgi:hypothetical protein